MQEQGNLKWAPIAEHDGLKQRGKETKLAVSLSCASGGGGGDTNPEDRQ